MKILVVSVYDSKLGIYSSPSFTLNRGSALRAWEKTCNDPSSDVGQNPSDYTLFEIGHFDDSTASFESIPHYSLGKALEFLQGNPRNAVPLTPTDLIPKGNH